MESPDNNYTTLSIAAGIGFLIAIGRVMATDEHVTAKQVIGRAILNTGLAIGAFSVLTFIPGLGMEGKIGMAALIASLGTTGAEMLLRRIVGLPHSLIEKAPAMSFASKPVPDKEPSHERSD